MDKIDLSSGGPTTRSARIVTSEREAHEFAMSEGSEIAGPDLLAGATSAPRSASVT